VNLEYALNHDLPPYQMDQQRREGREVFIVWIAEYPQCRGEGHSPTEALRVARLYFGAVRDSRVAWRLDELLDASAEPSSNSESGALRA
jgi:hypothetical protein